MVAFLLFLLLFAGAQAALAAPNAMAEDYYKKACHESEHDASMDQALKDINVAL